MYDTLRRDREVLSLLGALVIVLLLDSDQIVRSELVIADGLSLELDELDGSTLTILGKE